MIFGELALLLNLFAAATVAFFFGVGIVSAAGFCRGLVPSLNTRFSANGRRRLLWLAVLTPWLLALSVSAFLYVSLSVDVPWLGYVMHWHHPDAFHVYSWHAYPSIGLCLMCLAIAMSTYRRAADHVRAYRLLTLALNDDCLLESREPQAFSAGLWAPHVFISTGLMAQLDARELQVVRQHEQAHVERRDSLKKLGFSVLSSFFPAGVAMALRRAMSLCMEQCADERAVAQGADRVDVAKTLLKVTRLMRDREMPGNSGALQCGFAECAVETRVHYLLSGASRRDPSYVLMVALFGVIALMCLVSVDVLHHGVEALLSHP